MNLKRRKRLRKGLLKTGEIAKRSNLLPSCIKYYVRLGLLDVYGRTQGNFRLYRKKETLEKLQKIKFLKAQGMSLKMIKEKIKRR